MQNRSELQMFYAPLSLPVGVWVGLPNNEIHLEMEQGFTGSKTASPIAAKFFQILQKSKLDLLMQKK